MTRAWLTRTTIAFLPAIVISLSVPGVVWAQPLDQPPPPAIAAQPQPPPPPPVVNAPPERPMRFILTGGTVVIGTRVGEDAEFFTVNTPSGLVRVRKSDVASMDYNVSAGTQAPLVTPPPPALPPATFNYTAARPSRPGRGLLIAGTIMFSITYGLTVFGATIASVDNSDAFLLLLPVAGPVVYAAASDDVDSGDGSLALFINLTLLQGAGLIMLIVGASKQASASRQGQQSLAPNELRIGQADLRFDPVVTPGLQGLAVSGHF